MQLLGSLHINETVGKNIWRRVSPYRFACRVLPLRCSLGDEIPDPALEEIPHLGPPPNQSTKTTQRNHEGKARFCLTPLSIPFHDPSFPLCLLSEFVGLSFLGVYYQFFVFFFVDCRCFVFFFFGIFGYLFVLAG